jgi:hypothetical protein
MNVPSVVIPEGLENLTLVPVVTSQKNREAGAAEDLIIVEKILDAIAWE